MSSQPADGSVFNPFVVLELEKWQELPRSRSEFIQMRIYIYKNQDGIRAAYKKAARKHHPDRNRGREEEAAEKFKEISKALEILHLGDGLFAELKLSLLLTGAELEETLLQCGAMPSAREWILEDPHEKWLGEVEDYCLLCSFVAGAINWGTAIALFVASVALGFSLLAPVTSLVGVGIYVGAVGIGALGYYAASYFTSSHNPSFSYSPESSSFVDRVSKKASAERLLITL